MGAGLCCEQGAVCRCKQGTAEAVGLRVSRRQGCESLPNKRQLTSTERQKPLTSARGLALNPAPALLL